MFKIPSLSSQFKSPHLNEEFVLIYKRPFIIDYFNYATILLFSKSFKYKI